MAIVIKEYEEIIQKTREEELASLRAALEERRAERKETKMRECLSKRKEEYLRLLQLQISEEEEEERRKQEEEQMLKRAEKEEEENNKPGKFIPNFRRNMQTEEDRTRSGSNRGSFDDRRSGPRGYDE